MITPKKSLRRFDRLIYAMASQHLDANGASAGF